MLITLQKNTALVDGDTDKFWGIASTNEIDVQGDQIDAEKLNTEYLTKRVAALNWHHSSAPEDQVGFITGHTIIRGEADRALLRKKGYDVPDSATLLIEGHLNPASRHYETVKKTLGQRLNSFGLSVEGFLRRVAGKITEAVVTAVALTPTPAVPGTMVSLRKSASPHRWEVLRSYEPPRKQPVQSLHQPNLGRHVIVPATPLAKGTDPVSKEAMAKYASLPNANVLHTIHSAPDYFRGCGVTGNVELLAKSIWQRHGELIGDITNNYLDAALPTHRIRAIADLIAGERALAKKA